MTLDRTSSCSVALHLATLGYHVIPIISGTKAAKDKNWTELRLSPSSIPKHFKPDADPNVGLLLGTEVSPGVFPMGVDIDVDDDDLIRNVRMAFDFDPPAKKGKKGITYFARMPEPAKKRALNRVDPVTKGRKQVVELLATGQQTVIPPSIHPETKQPYEWVGPSLLDFDPLDLPEFTDQVMFEIELAVKKPDSPIFLLNNMTWAGEKGGGNVHNSVVTAVASLIGHQWTEDDIWHRVDRATRRAVLEFGDDYDWPTWEQEVRGMVRSGIEKGYANVTKKENPYRVAANWFLRTYTGDGRIYNRDGRLAIYKRGCFEIHAPEMVRHAIAKEYPEPKGISFSSSDWRQVEATVSDMATRFPVQPPHRRVCLQNGTFDMDDGKLRDWSSDDFLISRLEFDYDKDAECPVYDAFMKMTFKGNPDIESCINCFEEYVAMTLFECHDYQKFLVIKGPPGTGKSTLAKIARALHGGKNVSGVPVHRFGQERYQASMVGKLLNIVSEVKATDDTVDDFLKAVTSGDTVEVRFLYKETYSVALPTRLLIACNEMFRIRDTSGAVERRMIILSCPNMIAEQEQDKELSAKLAAELPGIFNRMARAWSKLKMRGHFLAPATSARDVAEFSMENNHTYQWVLQRTHQGLKLDNENYEMPRGDGTEIGELYLDYTEWARMNGFKQISSVTFGMKLSQLRLPNMPMDGKVKWVAGRALRLRPLLLLQSGRY